jgi:16S rRNA U516 pseudouridylate synthase RsuA-like enzyme
MVALRLQKVLARAGVASRRAAETLIKAGRVRVDGHVVTELGTKVDRGASSEKHLSTWLCTSPGVSFQR